MLPFIAGAIVGAAAVVVYNKNESVRNTIDSGAKKVKGLAQEGLEKSKELAKDVKATVEDKVESIKSKDKEQEIAQAKGE